MITPVFGIKFLLTTQKMSNVVKNVQHFKNNHKFIALINELNQYVLILVEMCVCEIDRM